VEKKEKNFEEKLKELENIVKDLESGDVNLDDAINKFNEAMILSKECTEKLKNVEEQVNKILTEDGKLEDFHVEE
jgi:exodeoxyribonuclease VII small subunit